MKKATVQKNSERRRILLLLRRLRASPTAVAQDEVLGRCERAALTCALTLSREMNAELTVVGVGPSNREDRVLAVTLRAGCHRAYRVFDESLGELDYLGVAQILAATARHLGFNLVICGDRSQDECQGATGPAVAEFLDIPHVSGVTDASVRDNGLLISRRSNGEIHEMRSELPALLCVSRFDQRCAETAESKDANESASYATRRGGSLESLTLAELDLDPRSLTHRRRFLGRARPKTPTGAAGGGSATLVASPKELADRLIGLLE